jgi:hypothetical protein
MVVIDMHGDARSSESASKLAQAGRIPVINNDKPGDAVDVNILEPFRLHGIERGFEKKIPHAFFLGAGKDERGLGIKLLRRDHGGQGIKICIRMAGDYIHRSISARGMQIADSNPHFEIRN